MPYELETLCLAVGIVLGMVFYQKTGLASGGIITPGVIALYIGDPLNVGIALVAGVLTWLILEGLVRFTGIYGRQRLAAALLIALALRYPLVALTAETSLWLGWVVPGLVGADMQRQGATVTLASAVAVSAATAMAVQLILMVLP